MKITEENCKRGCANVKLINRGIVEMNQLSREFELTAKILNLAKIELAI